MFLFLIYISYTVNNMRRISEFINEKLKVSKNYFSDITLESLLKALKDYKDRKHYEYAVFIELKEIFEECPVVLQYHGTYTNENIVGEKIRAIGYSTITKDIGNLVFLYFVRHLGNSISSIRILNTEELYDIFGEEALNKIYDYIIKQ